MGNWYSQPKTIIKEEMYETHRLLLKNFIISKLDELNTNGHITYSINTYIFFKGYIMVSEEKIYETLKEVIHKSFTYNSIILYDKYYMVVSLINY